MASSKAQKRKQQLRNRRKQRRRKTVSLQPNARHRERISRRKPRSWPDETPEDVAVFDDQVAQSLAPEMTGQAAAVREALLMISQSRGKEALDHVAEIPRSSPLSQWRLLIRGLVSWLENDMESAKAVWRRLETQRRPGRIAAALVAAHRTDLDTINVKADEVAPESSPEVGPEDDEAYWKSKLDKAVLYSAKLVRRIRIERSAIRIAEAGTSVPDEDPDLLMGPRKMAWLQSFSNDFRDTEPQLVAALHEAAVLRAYAQDYTDLFDEAASKFSGPAHDPRNSLLSYFYYCDSQGDSRADRYLENYLSKDLPANPEISEPLRQAIISQCYLNEASALSEPKPFDFFNPTTIPDKQAIRKKFDRAISAYPANLAAHKACVGWLQSQLDGERLTKSRRGTLEKELAAAMSRWSQSLPADVEPRLWLVDHLLENEQLEEAKPHVDWLIATRHDNPHVRATPWKWHLLEAMRLCRRKSWLGQVEEKLAAAESVWPAWLTRQWLPYLHSAWQLRCGNVAELEQLRAAFGQDGEPARGSLADACMMLGAAQKMRVPAADLKPLRAVVDEAANNMRQLDLGDLAAAGDFFWDLQRTRLLYPAYRMHGSKFGRDFFGRLRRDPTLVTRNIDDPQFLRALLWASEHRFWSSNYDLTVPVTLKQAAKRVPIAAAAILNATLRLRSNYRLAKLDEEVELLRTAAQNERDPFYRFWFESLVEQVEEANYREPLAGFGRFAEMFKRFANEMDFEDDFDTECDCPECQAARARSRRVDFPF